MPNTITGRLLEVKQTQTVTTRAGREFTRRAFTLDATPYDPWTGERSEYENILSLEVTGLRCSELDGFRAGDTVTVSFALQGAKWTNPDTGEEKTLTQIRCYRVELLKRKEHAAQPPKPVPDDDVPF